MNDTALCAHCVAEVPPGAPACPECGKDPRLDGRYGLLGRLGRGAFGTTYRARREEDGAVVCVKELLVRHLDDFKTQELFEREAQVLRELDHPGVVRYLDAFTAGDRRTLGAYLVTELVDGETLAAEAVHRRYTAADVLGVLEELLGVLVYLHGLAPPVVHRDLKPTNVMRRAGGGLVVIDFGAVKGVTSDPELGGSTIAGTFGYMPPEQLAGRASPASDLYALGAIAVELLSRRSPQDLLDDRNELRWREAVHVDPAFASLLGRLLTPDPAARASSAAAVLAEVQALIARPAGLPVATPAPDAAETPPPPSTARPGPPPRALPADFDVIVRAVERRDSKVAYVVTALGALVTYGLAIVEHLPVAIPVVACVALCGAGVRLIARRKRRRRELAALYRDGDVAEGVVVDVSTVTDKVGTRLIYRYRYRTRRGVHNCRLELPSAPTAIAAGHPLPVIFDPDDPDDSLPFLFPGSDPTASPGRSAP